MTDQSRRIQQTADRNRRKTLPYKGNGRRPQYFAPAAIF